MLEWLLIGNGLFGEQNADTTTTQSGVIDLAQPRLLMPPFLMLPPVLQPSDASAPSLVSTVEAVCAWATRSVAEGGAGLSAENVSILRHHEIDGGVLLSLTEAKLEKVLLLLGPREKLLAAIDRIRQPPGTRLCVIEMSVRSAHT